MIYSIKYKNDTIFGMVDEALALTITKDVLDKFTALKEAAIDLANLGMVSNTFNSIELITWINAFNGTYEELIYGLNVQLLSIGENQVLFIEVC